MHRGLSCKRDNYLKCIVNLKDTKLTLCNKLLPVGKMGCRTQLKTTLLGWLTACWFNVQVQKTNFSLYSLNPQLVWHRFVCSCHDILQDCRVGRNPHQFQNAGACDSCLEHSWIWIMKHPSHDGKEHDWGNKTNGNLQIFVEFHISYWRWLTGVVFI